MLHLLTLSYNRAITPLASRVASLGVLLLVLGNTDQLRYRYSIDLTEGLQFSCVSLCFLLKNPPLGVPCYK